MSTLTVPIEQHPTAADREIGLAVINRCMPAYAAGMHTAPLAVLAHESERLESMRPSPVIKAMRQIVDTERATRAVA